MLFLSAMAVTLSEHFLFTKLFYEDKGTAVIFREFLRLRDFHIEALFPQAIRRKIARFEKTGGFRGCQSTRPGVFEDIATAIIHQSLYKVVSYVSASAISRRLGGPYSAVRNILRKMVNFYSYKFFYN